MRYVLLLSTLLFVGVMAVDSPAAVPPESLLTWRKDDVRLEKPVTILAERAYVHDLASEVARQTGARIAFRPTASPVGDERLLVCCKGLPAWKLLDALASLSSYEGAVWRWERSGAGVASRYTLIASTHSDELPARLSQIPERAFERNLAAMIEAAHASPAERARIAERDPIVKRCLDQEHTWVGLRMFSDRLSSAELKSVLASGQPLSKPIAALGPEGERFRSLLWKSGSKPIFAPASGPEAPTEVEFAVRRDGAKLTSSLVIALQGVGGFSYAGGQPLNEMVKETIGKGWLLPGDAKDDVAGDRIVKDVPRDAPAQLTVGPSWPLFHDQQVERRVLELAQGASVPIVAVLPLDESRNPAPAQGKTVRDWVAVSGGFPPDIYAKWRRGVLLLRQQSWFLADRQAQLTPFGVYDELRRRVKETHGQLTLNDLGWISATLRNEQMSIMAAEVPGMDAVRRYQSLLRISATHPLLWKQLVGEGTPVEQLRQVVSDPALDNSYTIASRVGAKALRIVLEDKPEGSDQLWRNFQLQAVSATGKLTTIEGARWKIPFSQE